MSNNIDQQKTHIQRSANFFIDYSNYFGHPPKYVIYNKEVKNLAETYTLFTQYLSYSSDQTIPNINFKKNYFRTKKECNKKSKDIILSILKLQKYFEEKNQAPLAIKIDNCYISNADFLYLLAKMISDESSSGYIKNEYLIQQNYFEHIIEWKAQKPEQEQYVTFTMDYESDRPVFSEEYTHDKDTVNKDVKSIGINPKLFSPICYNESCTLPADYKTKHYSSYEVAWYTPVIKQDKIIYPDCYPYCGVLIGTPILLNEFIEKYGFPVTWHMTGSSIIAMTSKPELLEKVKEYEEKGFLDLGLHTMYHTNIAKVTPKFVKLTLNQNYKIFQSVFNKNPIQFRAPYLDLPINYISNKFMKEYVDVDNEVALSFCKGDESCNYLALNDPSMYFVKVDFFENKKDPILNIYLSHPWEILFIEKSNPTYLEESEQAKIHLFKKWMSLIGEQARIPVTTRQYLKIKNERR